MRDQYVKALNDGLRPSKVSVRKNKFDMYTHILVDTIIRKGLDLPPIPTSPPPEVTRKHRSASKSKKSHSKSRGLSSDNFSELSDPKAMSPKWLKKKSPQKAVAGKGMRYRPIAKPSSKLTTNDETNERSFERVITESVIKQPGSCFTLFYRPESSTSCNQSDSDPEEELHLED